MSSGTSGSNLGWDTSSGTLGPKFYKTWSGGDGKYEVYAGSTRPKWNNFTAEVKSRNFAKGTWVGVRQNGTQFTVTSVGVPSSGGNGVMSLSAAEQNRVLARILDKVKGHQFNLAVNLGQLKETVGTLTGTLDSLGRAFVQTRRGNFTGALTSLGVSPRSRKKSFASSDVSGRWLELQYGWLPMISDSYEAAKAFEAISRGPRNALFRASVSRKLTRTGGSASNGISWSLQGKLSRFIQYEAYEEMSVPRQLGLYDPASLLWELMPYSFVVDWFIPIGTYLDNLNQIPRLKGRWLVTDVTKWPLQRLKWTDHPDTSFGGGYKYGISYPDCRYHHTFMTRTVGVPSVPLPNWNTAGSLQGNRFWNAIALAYQRFGIR